METKPYKIVDYKFGIISNISLSDFIHQILLEEPQYDLFQVVDYSFWQIGGGISSVRYLILKLK